MPINNLLLIMDLMIIGGSRFTSGVRKLVPLTLIRRRSTYIVEASARPASSDFRFLINYYL